MDDNLKSPDQKDAFLPLPHEPGASPKPQAAKADEASVDLARSKVTTAYGREPDPAAEALDIKGLGPALHRSKHQRFIYNLTNSGKRLEDIQTTWHDYYSALPDSEKHQVWQEFYATHDQAAQLAESLPVVSTTKIEVEPPSSAKSYQPPTKLQRHAREFKSRIRKTLPIAPALETKRSLKSLMVGFSAGLITVFILLFSFFNERFIAPLIQPSRNSSNIQLIDSNTASSSASEVIIPKINVEIPVVYGVNTINDNEVNKALEQGVVHYADTAVPGQRGNVVIVGHSSNNILNKGRYKFAFVLLHKLGKGDIFYLQKDGIRYTYQVSGRRIVSPTDVSVLASSSAPTASLITCDPPGTSANRLVVIGTQIAPDPSTDSRAIASNTLAAQTKIIPGNSPTLWSRITHWFTN